MEENKTLIEVSKFVKNPDKYIGETIVVDCSQIIEDRKHTIGTNGFAAEYGMVDNSRYVLLFDREPNGKDVEISIFDRKLNKAYGPITSISYKENFENDELCVTYFTFSYNG